MGRLKSIWIALGWLAMALTASAQIDSLPAQESVALHRLQDVTITAMYEPYYIESGKLVRLDSLAMAQAATGNVGDLLRTMPSVSAKRYAPGGLSTPSFRGTGAGHTQVYWEGLPLNSPMLGQQDYSLSAGGLFDQVNVFYGGASLVLGSGGLGGALNLKSKHELERGSHFKLRLHQQLGSWLNTSTVAGVDYQLGKLSLSTNLYYMRGRNDFRYVNSTLANAPVERLQNAATLQFGGMQEAQFRLRSLLFTAKLWLLSADRALPPTMLVPNNNESQQDHGLRSMLGVQRTFSKGVLRMQGAYLREGMTYQNPVAQIYSPARFSRGIANAMWVRHPRERRLWLHEASLRYMYDQAFSDGFTHAAALNQWAGMAHGGMTVGKQHLVNLLVRQELNQNTLSPLLGMVGGRFALPLQGLWMQANVARNYRYPTLNDRYWVPGGNPDLLPELGHAGEMHLNYYAYLHSNRWQGITANLGGYFNHVSNWILWVPGTGAIWHPENIRTVNAVGLEASVRMEYAQGKNRWLWLANYTYSSTRDEAGYQLIYTPQHNAFSRLQWRRGIWDLQYSQDWNSRRYTVADNSAWLPGFSTADLSLGWDGRLLSQRKMKHLPANSGTDWEWMHAQIASTNRIHFQVGMRNILNAQYQTVAWRPMPGRSVFLRIDLALSGGPDTK